MIAERTRGRVRRNDRARRKLEDMLDSGRAQVRRIEKDAEAPRRESGRR